MSNIHSISSNRAKKDTKPTGSNSQFKGTARTLDGRTIEQKPDPIPSSPLPTNGFGEADNESGEMPPELTSSFWSWNIPQGHDIGCTTLMGLSFCPCFVGDITSEVRKGDWKKLFTMFTFWLSLVQLILYIVTLCLSSDIGVLLEPSTSTLLSFGANSKTLLRDNFQYYRIISYIFLHGSVFHILFNLLVQMTFTLGLEVAFGKPRYLLMYFISGAAGGLFSTLKNTLYCGVGASAALFGLYGAYITIIVIYWTRLNVILKSTIITWLVMFPIFFIAVSFLPNVDILGHVGGFLAGLFSGAILYCKRADTPFKTMVYASIGIIGLLSVILTPFLLLLLA